MQRLRAAAKLLDHDTAAPVSRDVSLADAEDVLNSMIGRDERPTAEEAVFMARALVGLYPAREVNDAAAYAMGVSAVLAAHPLDFCRRVCDPAHGLPSKLKWLPTLAEITAALVEESVKRGRIGANAMRVIKAHQEAEQERKWKAERPDAETRAKRAAEIMARFKPQSPDDIDTPAATEAA